MWPTEMHNVELPTLIVGAVAVFWIAGIFHFWRLQSRSRGSVKVTWLDRVMTVFWLPLYLFTITIMAVPFLLSFRRR